MCIVHLAYSRTSLLQVVTIVILSFGGGWSQSQIPLTVSNPEHNILEPGQGETVIATTCFSYEATRPPNLEVIVTLEVMSTSTALDGVDYELPLQTSTTVGADFIGNLSWCVNVTILGNDEFKGNRKAFFFLESALFPLDANFVINILENDGILLPYGEFFGDLVLPASASATPIQNQFNLSIPFLYFGIQEDTLYVTSNGIVSLGNISNQLKGSSFPFGTVPIIAPFWANINTEITGEILYRLTDNQTHIDVATSYINDAFNNEISPEMLFIATWNRVVEYTGNDSQFNTFQLVLTADGNSTFVIFLYGDIQWTSSFTNIGFNSRNSDSFYNLPVSIDLEILSNIDRAGIFVFRVDQESIQLPATTTRDSDNFAIITGFVIGSISVLLVVVIMVVVVVCTIKRCRSSNVKHSSNVNISSLRQLESENINLPRVKSAFDPQVSSSLIVNSCNLKLGHCIGQGEFGIVYKSFLKKGFQKSFTEIVAVKTLKATSFCNTELVINLLKECIKMKEFDHPNVLNLKGVCLDGGPVPYIIMPFMTNGSLLSYLRENRESFVIDPSSTNPSDLLSIQKKLLDMCIQVAKGMEYLTSKRIIHRDLAARNCMIDFGFVIKVADFGLSECLVDTSKEYFREIEGDSTKLPIKWLALESITDGIFSEKTDVWAFGVTCWEVFSGGETPYPDIHPMELAHQLETGYRMKKHVNIACSDEVYGFVSSCWDKSPENRPHFFQLVCTLSNILANIAEYFDLAGSNQATSGCDYNTAT